jgi:hypothetical protein
MTFKKLLPRSTLSLGLMFSLAACQQDTTPPPEAQAQVIDTVRMSVEEEPSDTAFEELYKAALEVKPGDSLPPDELKRLAYQLTTEGLSEDEFKSAILRYYALNASDVEAVLAQVRARHIEYAKANGQDVAQQLEDEPKIAAAVQDLNKYALEAYGLPFHQATLRGNAGFGEEIVLSHGLTPPVTEKAFYCAEDYYPRYVGASFPWRIRSAWSVQSRYRWQDGCNLNHGAFNDDIRNWIPLSGGVVGMVYTNGWGGKLAANNRNFYYKWWTLPIFGLTPWHMMLLLKARAY